MFQDFNTDTIESRFIKNLIYNTPIPIFKTIRKGDWMTYDCSYIYKRNLMRCTKSGIFYGNAAQSSKYKIVSNYIFGNYYPTFTEKYSSHNNYYDYKTHEMLGNYLRCYRDIYGIDLMPFYNCFSGHYTDAFYIQGDKVIEEHNSLYKVALFPVRFNAEYTICLDCSDTVSIIPLMLSNETPIITVFGGALRDLSSYIMPQSKSFSNTSFKVPFKYSVDISQVDAGREDSRGNISVALQQNERHLYLALQLPASNTSSILVLEGDYTKLDTNTVIDKAAWPTLTSKQINEIYLSPLSLMYFNDGNSYAFSNRLMEYLLLNVVTSEETIDNNISLFEQGQYTIGENITSGVWKDDIRYNAFNYYKNNYHRDLVLRFRDINGFMDKDMERLILGGK